MILIFIGCAILPLIIVNVFYYSTTEKNVQNEVMQKLVQTLSEKTSKVNGSISGTISLSNHYNSNEQIYKFLDTNYGDNLNYFVNYQDHIKSVVLTDLAYNAQVSQVSFYTDNPTISNGALVKKLEYGNFDTFGENLLDYRLDTLNSSQTEIKLRSALTPVQPTTPYDRSLSIIRILKYFPGYSNYQKAVRIDINLSYIASMLKERDLFDNLILVDSDNRIIASANTYKQYGSYDIFNESELEKGIVALKKPLKDVPLTLYGYYNSNIISQEFDKTRWKTAFITLCSILLAFACIMLVAGNITKRTKLLVSLSKNIALGNFIQVSQSKVGSDEIGILTESINKMSLRLQYLIDEKYKAELNKAHMERENAQAKLLALQSQVNPHFMFNTLECIRLKAIVKGESETAKIIMYISKMFRHLINWDDDIIFLSEDIKFLEEFLYVQKYRFEDEFEYSVTVDDKAPNCLLPKLVIQPVVENACVHGVEAISQNRKIEVNIKVLGGHMHIEVSDNGIGIDEARLTELKEMLSGGLKLNHSVGLYNVYQRLSLYYGRDFSIYAESAEGRGTKISIVIPVRYSKEEF